MSSFKIMVFPGLENISYTTEKKNQVPNPMVEFLSERSSVSQEQLFTIEQITSKHIEGEKRKNTKNTRQFVCPPILDLSMTTPTSELHQVNKPQRIFNGFFPSKIRTTNSSTNSTKTMKIKQDLFEEPVPDSKTTTNQNGAFVGRAGSSLKSEPARWPHKHRALQHDRKAVYSLRNGSPSPWVSRHQLKKNFISSSNAKEHKIQLFDSISRGLSR